MKKHFFKCFLDKVNVSKFLEKIEEMLPNNYRHKLKLAFVPTETEN